MVKFAYITNIDGIKVGWIVSGFITSYSEMASLLDSMSEEEVTTFDSHFKW